MKNDEKFVIPDADTDRAKTVVIINSNGSSNSTMRAGELSIVFSVIAIFAFAIIFVPLGIIFGAIALYKKQIGLGIAGLVLSLIAAWLSPTFWVLFGGAATIAAH